MPASDFPGKPPAQTADPAAGNPGHAKGAAAGSPAKVTAQTLRIHAASWLGGVPA